MTSRTSRARRRRNRRPEPSLCIADLLQPLELAELERMLDGDDAVRARMMELLAEHEFDAASLEVDVVGGRVRLQGCVRDPLTALLVEDLAWSMPQVLDCDNALHVDEPTPWSVAS